MNEPAGQYDPSHKELVRLKKPLLLFWSVAFLVVLVILVFSTYLLQHNHNENSVRREVGSVRHLFQKYIDLEADLIATLIAYTENDRTLQQAFVNGSREKLFQAALPTFKKFYSRHDITHFYFIKPDRTCFLRVHNPPRADDYLDRFTMQQAASTGSIAHGIELGPYGTFSLRVVKPWLIDGKPAGYIELAKEIHHITPQLKQILGLELFFLINKRHLAREKWQEGLIMLGNSGDWDEVPGHVIIDRTTHEFPAELKATLSLSHEEKNNLIINTVLGGNHFRGGFVPLTDASGREVGEIIALYNSNEEISAMTLTVIMLIISLIVGGTILTLFHVYTEGVEENLSKAYRNLEDEIESRKKTELRLYQHERNLEKIVQDRTLKLEQANRLLEREVEERLAAEESLREREAMLESSQEIAHIGSWRRDLRNNELIWSTEEYRIFGLSPFSCTPTPETFLQAVHPDDREEVEQAYRDAIKGIKPFDLVHRVIRPDGTVHMVHEKSEEIFDADGKAVLSMGMTHDITEQVQAEKALRESEEQLRLLIQSSEDMISLHDFEGRFTYYNGPSCYPVKSADVVGKTPYALFDRQTADRITTQVKETARTGRSATYENELDWFGEKIWFLEYIYPVFDGDGTITKVARVSRNINELKQAQVEIAASQQDMIFQKQTEAKIRKAYNEIDQIFNAAVPLCVIGLGCVLIKVNRAFCSYFGLSEEESVGRRCIDLWGSESCVMDDQLVDHQCAIRKISEGRESFQRDIDREINGRPIICTIHSVPYRDENGELLGIVSSFFDMTERKRAEENLHKTQRQLLHAEKLSAVGQLSASIAHEFNNPLQGVMTVLNGVKRRENLDQANERLVDLALSECNRMKLLIKDLQSFNRPTSGIAAPMDIHAAVDSILLISKKDLQRKGIAINKHFTGELPRIVAVSDQIKQIILNLINNAADACQEGGTITISTSCTEENVILTVQDTGVGITHQDMEHIFEPFFTTKPAVKGTGLGLSVSYGIAKKHGGSIEVRSTPGKGATFIVSLPIKGSTIIAN